MSKLKMLKFEAATLQKKGNNLIEELQKTGVAQIERFEDKRLFDSDTNESCSTYEKGIDVISDALSILSESGVKISGGMFSGREILSGAKYRSMSKSVDASLEKAHEICRTNKSISDLGAEKIRTSTSLDSVRIWEKLDLPLGFSASESSVYFSGTFPVEYTYESLSEVLAQELTDAREYAFEIVYSSKEVTAVFFVCHKSVEKQLSSVIRGLSFVAPLDGVAGDIKSRIAELEKRISELDTEISKAQEKIKEFASVASELKFAYDYFCIKRDECAALLDVKYSESTLYLRGYVPEIKSAKLKKLIEKNDGAVVFSEPDDEDDVPVLLSNGRFSEPCESIVEMYAMPSKFDIDPSKLMAFFYYLLFGMMLSDAGYGLVLFFGSLAILKFTTVEGSMNRMLRMFVYCGISTVFWGALFGSWFGDAIPLVAREFFGKEIGTVALWFDPLTDPITLLLFSFCIGIVHLFLGLAAFGYMKWKAGDKVGAIFDTVPVMMTVAGAAPLAAGVLVNVPMAISNVAKYIAIAGVILVVLTTARSGNILLRLGGGLYGLYNMASGYLSDILSYSRLLALGLATGCIGSVVNMLAVMVKTPGIKVVVFILVFIVGHSLNMAINVLGAYVHTNRLQFVELFSKFYEGGGRAFEPLKLNTKYYKISEEKEND